MDSPICCLLGAREMRCTLSSRDARATRTHVLFKCNRTRYILSIPEACGFHPPGNIHGRLLGMADCKSAARSVNVAPCGQHRAAQVGAGDETTAPCGRTAHSCCDGLPHLPCLREGVYNKGVQDWRGHACRIPVARGSSAMVEMSVESVRINLATGQRVVILKDGPADRYLFIWIAPPEAASIAMELQGTTSPRPLTHDLLKSVIRALGGKVANIVITDLVDDIFYARLVLDINGRHVESESS